jgi:hypothetical protein
VLDETGGMPEAIMVAAEAALASGIEVRIVQAGNPIQCEGPLWVAANRDRHLWTDRRDHRRPGRSAALAAHRPEWAREQIKSHGRDNPWVMANVLGKFPSASPLPSSRGLVDEAMKREATGPDHDPLVIGVDVARFGDDKTVIRFRKGRDARTHPPIKLRNLDNHAGGHPRGPGSRASLQADGVFVDGGGNGGGVIDILPACCTCPT